MNNFREKADLIWNLANLLRHDYRPHEYADVILPVMPYKATSVYHVKASTSWIGNCKEAAA